MIVDRLVIAVERIKNTDAKRELVLSPTGSPLLKDPRDSGGGNPIIILH